MECGTMPLYSVVIPCYKSAKSIEQVVTDTIEEFKKLEIEDIEFVLVNDCSPDGGQTIGKLYSLAARYPFVKVINLGKNSGQHNATMAGLNYATGDYIISMDDDLQTHPSQIKYLKEKIDQGYDLVYGYYEEKKESLFRRFGSALNYWTVRILINKPKWLKTSSFWMIRRYVRDYAIRYTHPNVHLQGVFLRCTGNIACVPIQHFERVYGSSTYTLKKLIQLYGNIVGYSMLPISLVTYLGFFMAAIGFLADVIVLIQKLINPAMIAGWASLAGLICLFCGLTLAALGVVGSYIGKLFIGQTNAPQFVVRDVTNITQQEKDTEEDYVCVK
jgi:undecaprenyl-phosphate 4-deoxy-4-formamido-L-arabinose transferase